MYLSQQPWVSGSSRDTDPDKEQTQLQQTAAQVTGVFKAVEAGEPMIACARAWAEQERGLVGDRYHAGIGTFSQRFEIVSGARALSLIDTFAIDIDQNVRRQAIVTTAADLAKQLDIRVIAEGVETLAEARWLYQRGIVHQQGYFYARPEIERLPGVADDTFAAVVADTA